MLLPLLISHPSPQAVQPSALPPVLVCYSHCSFPTQVLKLFILPDVDRPTSNIYKWSHLLTTNGIHTEIDLIRKKFNVTALYYKNLQLFGERDVKINRWAILEWIKTNIRCITECKWSYKTLQNNKCKATTIKKNKSGDTVWKNMFWRKVVHCVSWSKHKFMLPSRKRKLPCSDDSSPFY